MNSCEWLIAAAIVAFSAWGAIIYEQLRRIADALEKEQK